MTERQQMEMDNVYQQAKVEACPKCGSKRIDDKHFACASEKYGNLGCKLLKAERDIRSLEAELRTNANAGKVETYDDVLRILRRQEEVEVTLANLNGLNDRQQFVYSVLIVQKLIKDVEQRRRDSAEGGGR